MKRFLLSILCIAFYLITTSHELFLKTDAYFLSPGQATELYLFNGTFDKSENVITRDRILDLSILGPDFGVEMENENFYDKGDATYFRFSVGKSGTYVAGVSTAPRTLKMNSEDFNTYLEHEGMETTIAERKREGVFNQGAKEKYSKHVKAVLQVGNSITEDYEAILGYPIEFVPEVNPYTIEVGQKVSFKLLRNGKPLSNQVVHYSTSVPGKDAHESETATRTDANGIVEMVPTQPGNWYVATIHMEKSEEEGLDYESNWATLTFGVK